MRLRRTGRFAALLAALALPAVTGCGSDVVRVTGRVVENGQPVELRSGECVQIDLVTADPAAKLPLSLMTFAKKDGSFAADQNDGTGRGVPPGKYAVRLNRETTALQRKVHPALFKDGHTFDVVRGARVQLTIDIATGAISQ